MTTLGAVVLLGGCTTTTPAGMDVVDLNYFRIDCRIREQQLQFLRRQIPSQNDRLLNGLRMTSLSGNIFSAFEGTHTENRATFDGRQAAIAEELIVSIRRHCPPLKPNTPQCLHLEENMSSGASSGTQCRAKDGRAAITRWEAMTNE